MHNRPQARQPSRQGFFHREGGAVKHLLDGEGAHRHFTTQIGADQGDLAIVVGREEAGVGQAHNRAFGGIGRRAKTLQGRARSFKAGQIDAGLEKIDAVVDVVLKGLGKAQHLIDALVDKGKAAGEGLRFGHALQAIHHLGEHQNDVHQ